MMIVGVGASAGGLDALTKFVKALPHDSQMAFILVQHLDPAQQSLLVGLLQPQTTLPIEQATEGAILLPGHVYVIPPGRYLAVNNATLHLSEPAAPHGARMPFDFLLRSIAATHGDHAAAIILSGSGADGSAGLRAISEHGGLVIAQDPADAGYDGMPRSAIQTGAVDLILPAAEIPAALLRFEQRITQLRKTQTGQKPAETSAGAETPPGQVSQAETSSAGTGPTETTPAEHDWLPDIIELLRNRTAHNFRLYKRGTLQRRVERRMAVAAVDADSMERYLEVLKNDPEELETLAKTLLINVTSFFRDPKVFEFLAERVLPELVRVHPLDQPIRIWVAGCSTGEETYSLTMLLLEQIAIAQPGLRLQVFASDVDPDAVALAREGLYPTAIEAEVSTTRLKRFFVKESGRYRVSSDMRECVVFTVQDVLADPPFSRLDLVSCRNLLIYLRPEAQAKVISLFNFALREGGILLLGNSETIGHDDERFEVISKAERLYRHVGRRRPGEFAFLATTADGAQGRTPESYSRRPQRQLGLAELSRRLVLESYAPAAVLINASHECLYSMGALGRYLQIAPGHPTHDLLAMARPGIRTALRASIQRVIETKTRIVVPGGRTAGDNPTGFDLDIQPVNAAGEDLLLICFVDRPNRATAASESLPPLPRTLELERELEATRAELQGAIRDLEISSEEQKAINEEALSVNEEYQSTNEELLTSKEELQSLNEELTALNSQLQETLERQRTTADDLQNVLYSTDVATLFLDANLSIRFFTPATRAVFHLIPSDVGRPLADLRSLSSDTTLAEDALSVLKGDDAEDREIETPDGSSFMRRILPYRSNAKGVEGVVITFINVTERKRVRLQLQDAMRRSELANLAKSRFLASASHDLRQPLQALTLLQGLLAKLVEGPRAQQLVARLNVTLGSMTVMLNTLLDINQIDAGIIRAEIVPTPIAPLLERLRPEFSLLAEAKGLAFHCVPSNRIVMTDPTLLEQMLRNLLSNAVKYTQTGTVLLGCRRRGETLWIEVWDTGIGIPAGEIASVFDEFHQVDNPARERSRGLGLGLSIVRRLGDLIGHPIHLRSIPNKGSVFSIEVPLAPAAEQENLNQATDPAVPGSPRQQPEDHPPQLEQREPRTGKILLVEDAPDIRTLLTDFLEDLGHRVIAAADSNAALEQIAHIAIRPSLVLADYNLPNGLNGLELGLLMRQRFGAELPVVILTGDISQETLATVAAAGCVQLNKAVRLDEFDSLIQSLLPQHDAPSQQNGHVFIVDDDEGVRAAVSDLLAHDGRSSTAFENCEDFIAAYQPRPGQCLLLDAHLPGMSGLELLRHMRDSGQQCPTILMTGDGDVGMAVQAMKAGAADFIEKPFAAKDLLDSIARVLDQAQGSEGRQAWERQAADKIDSLTVRQHEIMLMVLEGHPSKNIAADLNISQRTVENHRAAIMHKTGSASLPALARLAIAASGSPKPNQTNP